MIYRMMEAAADLLSEGDNPEYDRALIELVAVILGLSPDDHRTIVEDLIRAMK